MTARTPYGYELILDLYECDTSKFNRSAIQQFFARVCLTAHVEPCTLYFWDDVGVPDDEKQTDPRTTGTSAIQFILTSNITVHTLDLLGKVFVNFFSCEPFPPDDIRDLAVSFFGGTLAASTFLERT